MKKRLYLCVLVANIGTIVVYSMACNINKGYFNRAGIIGLGIAVISSWIIVFFKTRGKP